MSGLLPLIFLWFANRQQTPLAASQRKPTRRKSAAPAWPTPASPPPMPAFNARTTPTPSADPSQTSTPLADLHTNPPKIAPSAEKQAALAAFKRKSTAQLKQRLQAQRPPPQSASASNVPVAALQKILISRGLQVVPDGLYGPRTASAWSTLAQRRQLPPTISRVGPKIAKVVTHTYEALSVPAIP